MNSEANFQVKTVEATFGPSFWVLFASTSGHTDYVGGVVPTN